MAYPEPTTATKGADSTTESGDWPVRVLALVPLAGLVFLWSDYHLGIGSSQPVAMAGIAAALPFAVGLLPTLLDKGDDEALRTRLRKAMARRVTWRAIAIAYLLLAAVAVTWTSVLVLAEDGGRLGRVTLRALDSASSTERDETPTDKDKPARFVLPTTPFGRPYRLEVDGYLPQTIVVYPILGARVRPGTDLRRSPSVLLRFSQLAMGSWTDVGGAELRIVSVATGGAQTLLATTRTPASTLFLGRAQPIPSDWPNNWRTELESRAVTGKLAASQLMAWRELAVLPLAGRLAPGELLRVTLTNTQNHVIAHCDLAVGKGEIQDQYVGDDD